MFLAVDIGNSCIKNAVFDGDNITFGSIPRMKENIGYYKNTYTSAFGGADITSCAIISVVNGMDEMIKAVCDELFGIESVILCAEDAKEIKIKPDCIGQVGMDRVANVYGVIDSPLPAIVVDIGTAVTFDILSQGREFLGGAIMPGVNMQLKALSDGTSKLFEVKPQESPSAIGNDTETCILSGVVRGIASAIDGLLEQTAKELGGCKTIILTGGQAELVSKYMKTKADIDKKHTVSGIRRLYCAIEG